MAVALHTVLHKGVCGCYHTYHHRSTESCCDYYFNAFSVLKIVLTIFHSEYGQSYHMRTMRIITGYKMWNSGIFCLICHHINKQTKKTHKCSHEVKKCGNLNAFRIPHCWMHTSYASFPHGSDGLYLTSGIYSFCCIDFDTVQNT